MLHAQPLRCSPPPPRPHAPAPQHPLAPVMGRGRGLCMLLLYVSTHALPFLAHHPQSSKDRRKEGTQGRAGTMNASWWMVGPGPCFMRSLCVAHPPPPAPTRQRPSTPWPPSWGGGAACVCCCCTYRRTHSPSSLIIPNRARIEGRKGPKVDRYADTDTHAEICHAVALITMRYMYMHDHAPQCAARTPLVCRLGADCSR